VPLSAVAHVYVDEGPAQIRRDNGRRRVQVTANLSGRDVGSVVNDLRERLARLGLPRGYYVEFGGNYESQRAVQRQIGIAFLVAVAVILLLLQIAFRSIRRAVLVLAMIPLALMGGILALLITGISLNVSSVIGLLAHFGLAVQKAVILVDYADDRVRAGHTPEEAARLAGEVRLRPVLMTALAASLAVLPLALGYGAGAEMQQPLAIVLIGGLVTSTLLTLLVIPALYPHLGTD
jgi:cobalt-zinc-cadmium resistance protein CzcA